ncbi:MAG: hypothetical protein N4Q15_02285 [Lactobacillus crispatus]|nr:hypothetical protein [Lactobacillus crispatus]
MKTRKRGKMKEIRLNDTIVSLNPQIDPLFGSISYQAPVNPHSIITIKSTGKTIRVHLNQIGLAVFKLTPKVYGFIWKSKLFFDRDQPSLWNEATTRLAPHELKANSIQLERE